MPGPRLGVREGIPKTRSKGYVRVNCVKGEGSVRNRDSSVKTQREPEAQVIRREQHKMRWPGRQMCHGLGQSKALIFSQQVTESN